MAIHVDVPIHVHVHVFTHARWAPQRWIDHARVPGMGDVSAQGCLDLQRGGFVHNVHARQQLLLQALQALPHCLAVLNDDVSVGWMGSFEEVQPLKHDTRAHVEEVTQPSAEGIAVPPLQALPVSGRAHKGYRQRVDGQLLPGQVKGPVGKGNCRCSGSWALLREHNGVARQLLPSVGRPGHGLG